MEEEKKYVFKTFNEDGSSDIITKTVDELTAADIQLMVGQVIDDYSEMPAHAQAMFDEWYQAFKTIKE